MLLVLLGLLLFVLFNLFAGYDGVYVLFAGLAKLCETIVVLTLWV